MAVNITSLRLVAICQDNNNCNFLGLNIRVIGFTNDPYFIYSLFLEYVKNKRCVI